MIILTVQFDHGKLTNYKKLFDVFKLSIEKNIPNAELVNIHIKAPARKISIARNLTYNTEKLKIWVDFLEKYPGRDIILIDCDMLCINNPEKIFLKNFDIGITFKSGQQKQAPMNGGVVFVKNNVRARKFMNLWLDINNRMYTDNIFLRRWQTKYLGMNQAAFGYIYEKLLPDLDVNMIEVPTIIYNAVDCDWKNVDEKTCFIHFKSELRRAVLTNSEPYGSYYFCMTEWYKYQEMLIDFTKIERNATKIKKHRRLKRRRRRRR